MALPPLDRLLSGRLLLGRGTPWLLRALWVALPFTVGPSLADALHGASEPVRTVASLGLWTGWGLGVAASLVAHPVSLTALRLLAPAVVVAALAAEDAG